jgi:hypothetical protein
LTPALDRPNSLKQTLEVVIPLNAFRDALAARNVEPVRSNSSREFNKLVFQSMNRIPRMKVDPVPFLIAPVNRIQLTADRALLFLGDEDEHYVVDDVVLISGIEQSERTGLKQALRQLVVGGTQIGTTNPKPPQEKLQPDDSIELPDLDDSLIAPRQEAMLK